MNPERLHLRPLETGDEASFRRAVAEFAGETPPWQFAFGFDPGAPFTAYVQVLDGHTRGVGIQPGFVPNSFLVGVVAGEIVGRVSLRHTLNAALATVGGHIGYGVIPSRRRCGYATEMLRQTIPLCAALGIERALLTCDESNLASRRVIESCGGVLENVVTCADSGVLKRRYWLAITARRDAATAPAPAP